MSNVIHLNSGITSPTPVCPKCGYADGSEDGAEMQAGITVYELTCDGCGVRLYVTRTVEVWYSAGLVP